MYQRFFRYLDRSINEYVATKRVTLSTMKVFYCDHFVLPLPPDHRFPMQKYRRLRERVVQRNHGRFELREPQPASVSELRLAHDDDYVKQVLNGQLDSTQIRALGFPWSDRLVERSRRSVGATIEAGRAALEDGAAASLAGGTHHAFRDHPQGFCVFNDAPVAARVMQKEGRIVQAMIIDCDVHQGNGTAAIVHNDPSVYTFSIHGARNFPFRKERSDLDVALPDGADDRLYLRRLSEGLEYAFSQVTPDLAFYLAGADAYRGDRWGRMGVTKKGLAERDRIVYGFCRRLQIPVVVVMAGGYADSIDDIVDIHFRSVSLAAELCIGQ